MAKPSRGRTGEQSLFVAAITKYQARAISQGMATADRCSRPNTGQRITCSSKRSEFYWSAELSDEKPYRDLTSALSCVFGEPRTSYGGRWAGYIGTRDVNASTLEEIIAQDAIVRQALRRDLPKKDYVILQAQFGAPSAQMMGDLYAICTEASELMLGQAPVEFVYYRAMTKWLRIRGARPLVFWSARLDTSKSTLSRREREVIALFGSWQANAMRRAAVVLESRGWI